VQQSPAVCQYHYQCTRRIFDPRHTAEGEFFRNAIYDKEGIQTLLRRILAPNRPAGKTEAHNGVHTPAAEVNANTGYLRPCFF
jgi:hypothetical protein